MTIGSNHQTLRAMVRDEIRQLIMTGELPPGTRLVEEALAERLGVSRNPVREALQSLAAEGFVELLLRRGAVVARLTAEDAEELFDVRMAVESLAARLAARNADAQAVDELRRALSAARDATEHDELDRLAELNTRFHSLVLTAGGNQYLKLMAAPLQRRVQWVFRESAASRGPHSWTEHAALLDEICRRDEEAAAAAAGAHVAAARASYRDLVAGDTRFSRRGEAGSENRSPVRPGAVRLVGASGRTRAARAGKR